MPKHQHRAWVHIRSITVHIAEPRLAALLDVPESILRAIDAGEVHPPSPQYCNTYRPLQKALGLTDQEWRALVAMVVDDRRYPVPNPRKMQKSS